MHKGDEGAGVVVVFSLYLTEPQNHIPLFVHNVDGILVKVVFREINVSKTK